MTDPKKTKPEDEPVRTAAEGVLRDLTFGLSDYVLAGASGAPYKGADGRMYSGDLPIVGDAGALDQSASIDARRKENPLASLAGEFAGAIINPVSRISAGATTVKGAMALGGVEGGLFGLGSALTEDALGDPEALHEQLVARVGGGALVGGALAGAFQKVLGGVERLTLSAETAELPKVLTDFADKASSTVRKSAITDDAALREAGISWDALHTWAQKEGLFNRATSPEALFTQADVAATRADDLAGAALSKLDELGAPSVEKLVQATAKYADSPGLDLAGSPLASKARAARKKLEGGAPDLGVGSAATEQALTWKELAISLREFDSNAQLQPLADDLRAVALAQAKRLDPQAAASLERAFQGRVYANFLKDQLKGADSSVDISSVIGNAAIAGLWGGPGAAVGSAASQVLGRVAQKRGPFVVSNLLDELPNASALKPLAESFLVQLKARLNTMPELLGPFRAVLENAAAGGAAEALATHMQLAQGPNGDEYLSTLGLVREGAADVEPYSQKAQTMAALMKLQKQVEERIGAAVEGKGDDASVKDFQQAYDAVQRLVKEPPVDDKLSGLPATQMGLTAKLSQAAQFVWASAPKDPNEHLPPALRAPWEPTAMERARFLARTQAAFEPVAAISAMLQGDLAQERLSTLSALYPRLLEQTTQKLFERLNSNKPLSWEQRQRLTPLLGPEALGLTAQQSAIIASVHAKSVEGAQAEARVNGRQVVDQSKNMQSQSQRIEARRSNT